MNKTKMKLKRRLVLMSAFCALTVTFYSVLATGGGFASQFAKSMPPTVALVSGMLASTFFSMMIFVFWGGVIARFFKGWLAPTAVALGTACSLISLNFASGQVRHTLNPDGVQMRMERKALQEIYEPLALIQERAEQKATAFISVASEMEAGAIAEEKFGNSCDGTRTSSVCGVRCRMRLRLAEESRGMARNAKGIAAGVTEIISSSNNIKTDTDWEGVYTRSRALLFDERSVQMRRWTDGILTDFETGFVDADTGRGFVCRDLSMEGSLRTLQSVLGDEVDLPVTPPPRPQGNFTASANESFEVLAYMLGGTSNIDRSLLEDSMLPMGFSILIEILTIVFIAITIKLEQRLHVKGLGPAPDDYNPLDRDRARLHVQAFDLGHYTEGRKNYFFEPVNIVGDPMSVAMKDFAQRFCSPGKRGAPIVLSRVHPQLAAEFAYRLPGATSFRVWHVPGPVMRMVKNWRGL